MKQVQFLTKKYFVVVKFEDDQDMEEVSKFESRRIKSLESRFIEIISEVRTWDSIRKISVRNS